MQTRPDAEFGQLLAEANHAGFHRLAVMEAHAVLHINAVSGSVLRNHQQLFNASIDQAFRLGEHVANRPAHQIATHRRNDAESAAVVTAFGNFQVSVVARRQFHALFRHQA